MRYLFPRGSKWHYIRRVPEHVAHLDSRGRIQKALRTTSLEVAKLRRDAMERADDLFWQGLALADGDAAQAAYDAAQARAVALGFEYKAAADLAAHASLDEIIRRVATGYQAADPSKPSADRIAVLGASPLPEITVTKAMEVFVEQIGLKETKGMSAAQLRSWKKVKRAGAARFVEVIGEKPLLQITRDDAEKFYNYWQDRFLGQKGAKKVAASTAKKGMGHMRRLFREYTAFKKIKIENPFDGLTFVEPKRSLNKPLPFPVDYIKSKFLTGDTLLGLNLEARCIFLVMVETGCRPSELCNLSQGRIHLKSTIPYIQIEFEEERKLKTDSSPRDIPLVGVALDAMKLFPFGFPRYKDKETNLSAALMKYFKQNKLLPTKRHRAYSVRHSFEDRMKDAGFSDDLRRAILGHKVDRPDYGEGWTLAYRQKMLTSIMLPYDHAILG
jgi:integrase